MFEWDENKNRVNIKKHGVSFEIAQKAFSDRHRLIIVDGKHSNSESRIVCIGLVDQRVLTVIFTIRDQRIRIISAGYWRKGKKFYEKKN